MYRISILLLCLCFMSTPTWASELPQPPIYQKDPFHNSALGVLPSFLMSETIDITKECQTIEYALRNFIGLASKCETDQDCVIAKSNCPFDCQVYVNKRYKMQVERKIAGYREICTRCKHNCSRPMTPLCHPTSKRCVPGK